MSSQSEYHVIVLIYLNGDYYKISVNRFYTVLCIPQPINCLPQISSDAKTPISLKLEIDKRWFVTFEIFGNISDFCTHTRKRDSFRWPSISITIWLKIIDMNDLHGIK